MDQVSLFFALLLLLLRRLLLSLAERLEQATQNQTGFGKNEPSGSFTELSIRLFRQEDLLRAFPSLTPTGLGTSIDVQATQWYSWFVMAVRAWCETAFEFLEYCFKAYMERVRKMNTGSRKISH